MKTSEFYTSRLSDFEWLWVENLLKKTFNTDRGWELGGPGRSLIVWGGLGGMWGALWDLFETSPGGP